jgi:hypothetical protein
MDSTVRFNLDNLSSADEAVRFEAFQALCAVTDWPVEWAGEVWDEFARRLDDDNSYQRTIGVVMLCNLAKSDKNDLMPSTFPSLLSHSHDASFITSRQCLQNLWKVAAAKPSLRDAVVDHLEQRFFESGAEKHANLLRLDVIQSLASLGHATADDSFLDLARRLIAEEPAEKYRKQYEKMLGQGKL